MGAGGTGSGRRGRNPTGKIPPIWLGVALLTLVAGSLRLYTLGDRPVWLDEALSWEMARSPYPSDVHPPLYFDVLRGWLYGFPNLGIAGPAPDDWEFWLRFPSALFATLTVPLVFASGRLIAGSLPGMTAALLFAIAPFQVRFGQEARTYALLTLAAVVVMWAVTQLLSVRRSAAHEEAGSGTAGRALRAFIPWLAYTAGTGVALYCHNTSVFLLLAANLAVFASLVIGIVSGRKFLVRWLAAQGIVLLIWAPWLPTLLTQTQSVLTGYWIAKPGVSDVVYATRELLWNAELLLVADLVVVSLVGLAFAVRRHSTGLVVATAFFLVPWVAELLVSIVQPIFLSRTLIWTAVPLYLLMGLGVERLRKWPLQVVALTLIVAFNLISLDFYYRAFEKEAWDEAAAYAADRVKAGDVEQIFFDRGYVRIAFDYYFRQYGLQVPETPLKEGEQIEQYVTGSADGNKVLLVLSHNGDDTRSADSLAARGEVLDIKRVSGIVIALFELN